MNHQITLEFHEESDTPVLCFDLWCMGDPFVYIKWSISPIHCIIKTHRQKAWAGGIGWWGSAQCKGLRVLICQGYSCHLTISHVLYLTSFMMTVNNIKMHFWQGGFSGSSKTRTFCHSRKGGFGLSKIGQFDKFLMTFFSPNFLCV